jgi:hypothetical protein
MDEMKRKARGPLGPLGSRARDGSPRAPVAPPPGYWSVILRLRSGLPRTNVPSNLPLASASAGAVRATALPANRRHRTPCRSRSVPPANRDSFRPAGSGWAPLRSRPPWRRDRFRPRPGPFSRFPDSTRAGSIRVSVRGGYRANPASLPVPSFDRSVRRSRRGSVKLQSRPARTPDFAAPTTEVAAATMFTRRSE